MSKLKYLLVLPFLGIALTGCYYLTNHLTEFSFFTDHEEWFGKLGIHKTSVIGFLPYWLVDEIEDDYSNYLTNLTYFGLAVDGDGTIYKDEEPGYAMLDESDLLKELMAAKDEGMELSLLLYAADDEAIDELIENPVTSANNLVEEIIPIMNEYGYTDLDVDLETLRVATKDEQIAFTEFFEIVSTAVHNSGFTITICLPVGAFSYDTIISPEQIQPLTDKMVIMTYDFFYRGSFYTGPNAPINEIESVIESVLATYESEQIILGIPLYNYTWETIKAEDGAAIIPSSGETLTQKELTELLADCDNCKSEINEETGETILYYQDEETGSYHVTYYPGEDNFEKKINLVKEYNLGGVAFWALGYENEGYLAPFVKLKDYLWQDNLEIF